MYVLNENGKLQPRPPEGYAEFTIIPSACWQTNTSAGKVREQAVRLTQLSRLAYPATRPICPKKRQNKGPKSRHRPNRVLLHPIITIIILHSLISENVQWVASPLDPKEPERFSFKGKNTIFTVQHTAYIIQSIHPNYKDKRDKAAITRSLPRQSKNFSRHQRSQPAREPSRRPRQAKPAPPVPHRTAPDEPHYKN